MFYSGWYDPLIQNVAYLTYATNAPGYGPIANDTILQQVNNTLYKEGGCYDQERACYAAGPGNVETPDSDTICKAADDYCVRLFPPSLHCTVVNSSS